MKVKDKIQDWLESGGWELGYDYGRLPDLSDFNIILKEQISCYNYKGEK